MESIAAAMGEAHKRTGGTAAGEWRSSLGSQPSVPEEDAAALTQQRRDAVAAAFVRNQTAQQDQSNSLRVVSMHSVEPLRGHPRYRKLRTIHRRATHAVVASV